ncbi:class I SAM-dependent methyltransferase [Shewanella baltica]|uniref:class I SAM-dependent methyltransferase n=1 Tax=Shewanella baltica TaxID=62322 RepID=UPI003CFD47D7
MILERIEITRSYVDDVESDILYRRHIERYCLARKFLFGNVLDVACGVGYGAYLISKNPDIITVNGYDINPKAINDANNNFNSENVKFFNKELKEIEGQYDCLLSLETIEHLDNPREIENLAKRCGVKEILLSFPNKKTTHYNKYHKWDITLNDVQIIFSDYYIIETFDFYDSTFVRLLSGMPKKKYIAKSWLKE